MLEKIKNPLTHTAQPPSQDCTRQKVCKARGKVARAIRLISWWVRSWRLRVGGNQDKPTEQPRAGEAVCVKDYADISKKARFMSLMVIRELRWDQVRISSMITMRGKIMILFAECLSLSSSVCEGWSGCG